MKRKLLAGLLIGSLAVIPALNISNAEAKSNTETIINVGHTIDNRSNDKSDRQRPPMRQGQSDENGNPLPPPDMNDRDGQSDNDKSDRQQPPEPPKDENGNPLPPPNQNDRNGQQQMSVEQVQLHYGNGEGCQNGQPQYGDHSPMHDDEQDEQGYHRRGGGHYGGGHYEDNHRYEHNQ